MLRDCAIYTCAPLTPSSSPLLMLNMAVRLVRCIVRYFTNASSVATPIPSSVTPGAVGTESKWAELERVSPTVKRDVYVTYKSTPPDSENSGSVPCTFTSTLMPSKETAWERETQVAAEVRSPSTVTWSKE